MSSLIAQQSETPQVDHQRLLATPDFIVFRIRLGVREMSDFWRHPHPVLMIPTENAEVLERITSTPVKHRATWKALRGVRLGAAGDTHTIFNSQAHEFVGIEIEMMAESVNLGLTPRFSSGAPEQHWNLGSVQIGRHVLYPGQLLPPEAHCDGILIALVLARIGIQEDSKIRLVMVEKGEPINVRSGDTVSNAGDEPMMFLTVCRGSSVK